MSLSYDSWIRKEESLRRAYDTLYKQKQEVLLLKKKSHTRWPLKTYNRKTHAIKERQVYTSVDKKYPSKPHINRIPSYSYRPLDPQLTKTPSRYESCSTTAPDYHDSVFHDVTDYVENALKDQKKESDQLTQHENKVDLIKDLSIHLMDQLLHQIMNTGQETDKPLDWEFIMANLIQLKALPIPIIDRIKRQMESKTGKKIPAIDRLNSTWSPLPDLTLSDSEREMQAIVQSLHQTDTYESIAEDEPFQKDVKWLLSLVSQDPYTQQQSTDTVQTEYTHKILDLKKAFF